MEATQIAGWFVNDSFSCVDRKVHVYSGDFDADGEFYAHYRRVEACDGSCQKELDEELAALVNQFLAQPTSAPLVVGDFDRASKYPS